MMGKLCRILMRLACVTKWLNGWCLLAGASIPSEAMMHFPPPFQIFPLFSKNFQTLWKIFQILPFPEKFLDFIRQNFWWPFFLVIDLKFRISPLFRYISPPVSRKLLFPPTFKNFPPVFEKFTCFLHAFLCISFLPLLWPWCIYVSHNARTGRPCLDTWRHLWIKTVG